MTVCGTGLIMAACAETEASPHTDICGCTHLSELVGTMATGVIQTLAGAGWDSTEHKPMQLDGCHALQSSGPVVARHYPKWYRKPLNPELVDSVLAGAIK